MCAALEEFEIALYVASKSAIGRLEGRTIDLKFTSTLGINLLIALFLVNVIVLVA